MDSKYVSLLEASRKYRGLVNRSPSTWHRWAKEGARGSTGDVIVLNTVIIAGVKHVTDQDVNRFLKQMR